MSTPGLHDDFQESDGQLGGQLAGLSLPRQIWKISLWPFIEQVLAFVVSASSLVIASRLGEKGEVINITDGMAAVSYIAWMGFVLQGAVAMGSTALIARFTGARKFKDALHAGNQTLLLGLLAGILSCILMLSTLDFLLETILNLRPEAAAYAKNYMHIMAFAAPFSGMVFAMNGALRGAGDTRTPFLIMAEINLVTVGMSCLFVWGPGILGGHGVSGIAMGVVVGFAMGLASLVFVLHKREKSIFGTLKKELRNLDVVVREKGKDYVPPLYLDFQKMRFDWPMIWRIIRIGGPQAVEIFLVWAIQFYSLRIVGALPEKGALGAHLIVVRTESMSFLPGFAIGTAAAALVGQYLGAGNAHAARQVVMKCGKYAIIFMGSFGVLFFLFPAAFVGIFASKSPELVELAAPVLQVAAFVEVFFAAAIVLKMSLRGAGDTKRVMLLTLASIGFWRVIVLTAWAKLWPETLSLFYVWILFGVDVLMQSVLFWKMFKGNKWTRYEV